MGHALSPERSLHFWSSCLPQHKRQQMAPRLFAMRPFPRAKTHFSVLREADLRQLAEKAQLSGELVTMCLESAFELQAGTSAHTKRSLIE